MQILVVLCLLSTLLAAVVVVVGSSQRGTSTRRSAAPSHMRLMGINMLPNVVPDAEIKAYEKDKIRRINAANKAATGEQKGSGGGR